MTATVDTTAITRDPVRVNADNMRSGLNAIRRAHLTYTGVQAQRDRVTNALAPALDALDADPTLHLSATRRDPVLSLSWGVHQWGHASLMAEHTGQFEALADLTDQIVADAETVVATAEPDWHDPDVSRRVSGEILPSPVRLAAVADRLREEIRQAMAMPVPHPQAQRLAALADQIHPQA